MQATGRSVRRLTAGLVWAWLLAAPAAGQQPPAPADPARTLYQQALTDEQQGRRDDAAAKYEQAIVKAPKMAEAYDRLGFIRGQQGRTGDAIELFAKAVALKPTLFDAQYHLGATRWWTHDYEGALPALQAAVKLQPHHPEARTTSASPCSSAAIRRVRSISSNVPRRMGRRSRPSSCGSASSGRRWVIWMAP